MTIEWYVLATPFAVLPVILFFAFVGCALDAAATNTKVVLDYQSGLHVDVKAITVTLTYTVPPKPSDAEIGNQGFTVTADPITVANKSIKPAGGSIVLATDQLGISDVSSLTCDCTVMTSTDPSDDSIPGTVHVPSGSPLTKWKDEDESQVSFSLSRLGNGFVIS